MSSVAHECAGPAQPGTAPNLECRMAQPRCPSRGINSVFAQEICVPDQSRRVLVINPGSTSTKFGVFSPTGAEWVTSVLHGDAELEQFRGRSSMAQADYRFGII